MPDTGSDGSTARGAVYAVRGISVLLFGNGKIGTAHIDPQRAELKDGDAGNFVRMINRVVVVGMLQATVFRPIDVVAVPVILLMLVDQIGAPVVLTDPHEFFANRGMGQRPKERRDRKGGKKQDTKAAPIVHSKKHSAV